MSLYDLIQRAEAILEKYKDYDDVVLAKKGHSGGDAWSQAVEDLEAQIEQLTQQADEIAREANRAVGAAGRATVRKQKETLLKDGLDALQKKLRKGKVTKEVIQQRQAQIQQLAERINNIPDGLLGIRRPLSGTAGQGQGARFAQLNLDASSAPSTSEHYYAHTDETKAFENEAHQAFGKQDAQLDRIANGVDELKHIAQGLNNEIENQFPIIDDIDKKLVDRIAQLKTNNAKLKGVLEKMRSSRNFCVDVILIALLLGIGAYIYTLLK